MTSIIRQDQGKARGTTGLAQSRKLRVEIRQGRFQHLAELSILGGFELLNHSRTGQEQTLALTLAGELIWGELGNRFQTGGGGLRLLLLHRLALPAASHGKIIFRRPERFVAREPE